MYSALSKEKEMRHTTEASPKKDKTVHDHWVDIGTHRDGVGVG
jgi:hypothetical protein